MKKLSASSIKYLLEEPAKFINKFTLNINIDEASNWLILWWALHKIVENYIKTGTLDTYIWYMELERLVDENSVDWERPFSDDELEEMIKIIDSTTVNLQWTIEEWWESEVLIQTDDFIWYIDQLKDWVIKDYKFVSRFNQKWMFDSMPWYIIQMALYAWWYKQSNKKAPKYCEIIEVLKWDTLITDVGYYKKDYLIQLAQEQHPGEEIDSSLTREKIIEKYPIRWLWYKKYIFKTDKKFLRLWEDILTIAIDLRSLIISFKNEEDEITRKQINNQIKSKIKQIRKIVLDYLEYYRSKNAV